MWILQVALAAFLSTRGTIVKTPVPSTRPVAEVFGAGLAQAIKTDLESISGPGTVDVSIDHETLFSVRIAIPGFEPEIYTAIYDRELKLYRIFPELNFEFYVRLKPANAQSQP